MKELIKNLEELNRKAEKGGGDARIEKQHSVGKLTARERIDLLLEKGSFIELDKLVTHRCTDLLRNDWQTAGLCFCTGLHRIRRGSFGDTRQEDLQSDGHGDADGSAYYRTQ